MANEMVKTEMLGNWDGARAAPIPFRLEGSCQRCGFSEIRTDEVVDGGVMYLAQCPRCEHRWTSREPIRAALVRSKPISVLGFGRVPARAVEKILPAA
jgi:hypothetical protein